LPDRKAADDAGPVSALPERASPRVQPDDEPRSGRRLRRADDPRGADASLESRLGAAGERSRLPGGEVPPPPRRRAGPRRRGDLAPRGAHAPRPADAGRAQAADGAAAFFRIARDARGDARPADRARPRGAAAATARPEGGSVPAAPRRRGGRGGRG